MLKRTLILGILGIDAATLPPHLEQTHVSLFDGSNFNDSYYFFELFVRSL